MLFIGLGKGDITAFFKGIGMLGYGLPQHHMLSIETPLYARAFVFEQLDKNEKVCLVNCELGFITPSLKQGVLAYLQKNHSELKYTNSNLLLCAQHTHCGPSGYSHHVLYNMSTPGFHQGVYDKIVNGIIDAILQAEKNKQKASIQMGKSAFAADIPVSFNRVIEAYNSNPEVSKQTMENRHLAVDREMTLLHFISETGQPLGSINWFAVHTSNLPNNYYKLCSDNKGFAATYLEESMHEENQHYVAAFAQGACGDVSARVNYNSKLPATRGKWEGYFPDDLKSSKFNGNLQYEKAKEIIKQSTTEIKDETIDSISVLVDFSHLNIHPNFTNGIEQCVTSPSCMGVAFLEGSLMDGPGLPLFLGKIARKIARSTRKKELKNAVKNGGEYEQFIYRKNRAQSVKDIGVASGERTFLGNFTAEKIPLPGFVDEMILNIKKVAKQGGFDSSHPWTPQVLTLQILKIGTIGICAFPFEITTVASWRLKKTLEDSLKNKGIDYVVLCPYSNEYNGYITTNEEYQLQMYEAGHNVFGQWSLNALQQQFSELAIAFKQPKQERNQDNSIAQEIFTAEELSKQVFFQSNRIKKLTKNKNS
ncbi:MAG TPA: neutral/alkaline non-lysosomal ceramidase N-terminal domain-containing protein [Chitinophagales bacterium]|jgi:neutral ceramidase|nr:neutral/alkaline non-lysosomal ceramidase N-terminal domain-containing protein [Chitinophagales bacterium]HQW78972.1 neutral/alkaline non-lysosomal ceramidase N-terminal domain-containing protein [Chitinophagales bacterium]HRB66607.1 neutral/alkaline non-lysosomal ceramidase N-terminal domain-containing protein [Chitinophagales bacterium]